MFSQRMLHPNKQQQSEHAQAQAGPAHGVGQRYPRPAKPAGEEDNRQEQCHQKPTPEESPHSVVVGFSLANEWLVNDETHKNHPFKLRVGEPLPERPGLPIPQTLTECNGVTALTDGEEPSSSRFGEPELEEMEL